MNEEVCYCVIHDGAMGGYPPHKVFLSERMAREYAADLNTVYQDVYSTDSAPYFVEECALDRTEEVE